MAIKGLLLLVLIALASTVARSESDDPSGIDPPSDDDDDDDTDDGVGDDDSSLGKGFRRPFGRKDFPANFIFGTASSAYQISRVKFLTWKEMSRCRDGPDGVGCGIRHAVAWPAVEMDERLDGYPSSRVNEAGIRFYNNLIDELLSKGIEPYVTLFHWDLPQVLESDYKGFLNSRIVNDFRDYADLCFRKFGDRVKYWITVNEPWSFSTLGYAHGTFPPNRCSDRSKKDEDEDGVFLDSQKGQIGITLNTDWLEPFNERSKNDQAAAYRSIDFMFGWFMEPLHSGSYPDEMVKRVGKRLPTFSASESRMLIGSFDFIGLNYYTASYAADKHCLISARPSYLTDPCVNVSRVDRYNQGGNKPRDVIRRNYHRDHLKNLSLAIKRDDANVKGYFVWSFLDNFEWVEGYRVRFGIIYVNYEDGSLERLSKNSSNWFKKFLK
ncbi:hypothetical protein F0562_014547 [Nyssa sinensis]|uniref:Beta-glucosidase n=1 Tax=Nyssa sinensis TaxID=561372 RepID=A0A5J4ZP61_9ASTE|nr:hypothetical protein F0562_014547 [Nyssa sinensis]